MTNLNKTTFEDTSGDSLAIPQHCVRERAYEIYERRGRKGCHADSDWLTAEAELKELKKKAADLVAAVQTLTA
jgi:hypothetical protein